MKKIVPYFTNFKNAVSGKLLNFTMPRWARKTLFGAGVITVAGGKLVGTTSCNGNPPEVQRKDKHKTMSVFQINNANRAQFIQKVEDYLAKPTTDNIIFDLIPSEWDGGDFMFVENRYRAIQEVFSTNPNRLSGNPDIKVTPAGAWRDTQERLNQKNFNVQALYLAIRAQ